MDNVMQKTVNISNDSENLLEFDIEIEGVEENDMEVRFVIEGNGIDLGFNSKKISDNTWSVEIPPMKMLDAALYPYYISVIVDGYAFRGIEGSINVLCASDIIAKSVVNTSVAGKTTKKVIAKKKAVAKKKVVMNSKGKQTAKDRKEMLDDLSSKKVSSKDKSGLEASIEKTIEKARKEVQKSVADNKKATEKDKVELDSDVTKIIDKAKKEIDQKFDNKKGDKKGDKKEVDKKVEEAVVETLVETNKPSFSAKESAKSIIDSVFKRNKPAPTADPINESEDKKQAAVKEILSATTSKDKPVVPEKKAVASGKKIIRGKHITEVDSSKEDKIKDALKEDAKRSVTTTPVNKTIH